MCGLVGVFGTLTHYDRTAFKTMLYVDAIRGHHSTGVVNAKLDGTHSWLKKAVTAIDFLDMKKAEDLIRDTGCLLIGHNRYATKGAINAKNAHPFEHGSIVGVHNGTLTRQSNLPDHERFDVDSENIYYSMDLLGTDETIKRLEGHAALVWWDSDSKTLNIWRNSSRTLYLVLSQCGTKMYWASEKAMLDLVISKDRDKSTTKWGEPFLLRTETLMTFSLSKSGERIATKVRRVAGHKPRHVVTTSSLTVAADSRLTYRALSSQYPFQGDIEVGKFKKLPTTGAYEGEVVGKPWIKVRVSPPHKCQFEWLDQLTEEGATFDASVQGFYLVGNSSYGISLNTTRESSLVKKKQPLLYIEEWDLWITEEDWLDLTADGCQGCKTAFLKPEDVGLWDYGVPYCKNCQ